MFRAIMLLLFFNSLGAIAMSQTIVEQHGQLSVKGSEIVNERGEAVQLRGMSSHGLQWFGNIVGDEALLDLRNNWGITVFRAAMYTAQGGYAENPKVKTKLVEIVEAAIDLGIYVVIDWHILYDNNPQIHQGKAIEFFAEMSKKYAGIPNVIYEICNEPNGNISWGGNIKPYAEVVVKEIRKNDSKNLIIVGSGSWSQNIQDPANDPLRYQNIAYALHFYSGSHGQWLRDRIDYARSKGIAIVVTEWGTTDSSGKGRIFIGESDQWLDFLDARKISWMNWSYSNAGESSAAITWDYKLTESGRYVKSRMLK